MKKMFIVLFLALSALSTLVHAEACRAGYSVGFLKDAYIKSRLINASYSEIRGSELIYSLSVQLSTAKNSGKISGSNSIDIKLDMPATDNNGKFMEYLINNFEARKIAVICVKSTAYDQKVLPKIFNIIFGQSLELDINQPVAK